MKNEELEKVKNCFSELVKTIDETLCSGFAQKNPGLIQHLMDKVQQEEDRRLQRVVNNIL